MKLREIEIGMTVKTPWTVDGKVVKGTVVSINEVTERVTVHEPAPKGSGAHTNVMRYHVSELKK